MQEITKLPDNLEDQFPDELQMVRDFYFENMERDEDGKIKKQTC